MRGKTWVPSDQTRVAAKKVSVPVSTVRDPRLDFYRGIAMFIILLAHTPGNWWTLWIPARFGFSDATEIFVFCSGMASAIAFGGSFLRHGWWVGTARVLYRVWQVYWAHIGLFFTVAFTLAFIDGLELFKKSYVGSLNLLPFFKNTGDNLVGLMTLTYVPNYFDILPMYLVILAMLPVVMLLARVSLWAVAAAVTATWFITNLGYLDLPAEPWSERGWFFNPFGWQLVFFTGFAFMAGWLPKPPINKALVYAAVAILLVSLPLSSWKFISWVSAVIPDLKSTLVANMKDLRSISPKTDMGFLRYIHFLALAYLGYVIAGDGGSRLIAHGTSRAQLVWAWLVKQITKVGQQSLAVFVFSMAFARLLGFAYDQIGRNFFTMTIGNLIGFALLIAVAYSVAWFKSQPWRKKAVS